MSTHQRVLFTALPNGVDALPGAAGGFRLHLSVHVAPRLTTDPPANTTLAGFGDWVDWPATIAGFGWDVTLAGAAVGSAAVSSEAPRSDLWAILFGKGAPAGAGTLVRSHTPEDFSDSAILSAPAANVADFLEQAYTKAATTSPTEWVHYLELLDGSFLGPLAELVSDTTLDDELAADKAIRSGPVDPSMDFALLRRFHRPRGKTPDGPVAKPVLDFHEAVATIGQHPHLMRLLGLVVDLEVIVESLPASPTTVSVAPTWASPATPGTAGLSHQVSPRTACVIGPDVFMARPRLPGFVLIDDGRLRLVDGRLPLDNTDRYKVVSFDIDGAATKVVELVNNINNLLPLSAASPDRYALPALRSGGLSVARSNRAVGFHGAMVDAGALNGAVASDDPIDVFAEDLTRGYAIDVRHDHDDQWRSLCAREGAGAQIDGGPVAYGFGVPVRAEEFAPANDEGFVSTVATSAPPQDPPAAGESDLWLQESLFRWGGWSLVAPRPGGRLDVKPDAPPTFAPNAAEADLPLAITLRAKPKSLPRLRFGHGYRVRARAVDLAGNRVTPDPHADDPHASPEVRYLRFEPVASPPVLMTSTRAIEGESLERVVLRSNYNQGAADFGATEASRHIVPPKSSQLFAEQHGMFDVDNPTVVAVEPARYGEITAREAESFASLDEAMVDPDDNAGTLYFPVTLVPVPYLPDPLARGAALSFRNYPGVDPDVPLEARFTPDAAWPSLKAVRLIVRERVGGETPSFDAGNQFVTVPLDKGDTIEVRLSCFLSDTDLADGNNKFAIWQWMRNQPGGAALFDKVRRGLCWLITPYRTLTLVHAVKQPLVPATALSASSFTVAPRATGETFAKFQGTLHYSRKSTTKVDVAGEWDEWIDDGPGVDEPSHDAVEPVNVPTPRAAPAFTIPGDRPSPSDTNHLPVLPAKDRHEFGDTKHRNVHYRTVATTRFAEHFARRHFVVVDYPNVPAPQLVTLPTDGNGVIPGTVSVKRTIGPVDVADAQTYVEGTAGDLRDWRIHNAAAGVIALQKSGNIPEGQTVTITYQTPPITRPVAPDAPFTLTAEPINIKSSARPAAPKALYVVPTFAWSDPPEAPAATITSTRLGNGLRVYLERPWWSSGEGELLGVLVRPPDLASGGFGVPVDPVHATQWGMDPVFASRQANLPSLAAFPRATVSALGLSLPGVRGVVHVAGHPVAYDRERDLWFCDIDVDAGDSYFPFIRLALARFQPHSIAGAELSAVVRAEFAQLTPDRFASVVLPPGAPTTRGVTVFGRTFSRSGGRAVASGIHEMQVTVQRRDTTLPDEDLGWIDGATTTLSRVQDPTPQQPELLTKWQGDVTLSGPAPHRLLIREFEIHLTGEAGAPPVAIERRGRRLVYSDVIPLNN